MAGVGKLEFSTLVNAGLFDPSLIDARSYGFLAGTVPKAFGRTENLARFIADKTNVAFALAKQSRSEPLYLVSSNLGRRDFPGTFGDLHLDRMYFLPAVSPDIPLILGAVTVSGRLTFSFTYLDLKDRAQEPGDEKMNQARDRALEYLGFPKKTGIGIISRDS